MPGFFRYDFILASRNWYLAPISTWRSQVILADGLLDFYIHEINKYCLVRMLSGTWPKTEKYKSSQIPMKKAFPSVNNQEVISIGKETITMLFQQRNEILHQNNRSHTSAEQTDITKEFIEDYISKIESIVNAIQEIAKETNT